MNDVLRRAAPPSKLGAAADPHLSARVLWRIFGVSCLIFLALELYRPFYFLGDDNLIYWYPIVHGLGNRLQSGQSPFVDPNLFGGYRLLSDPVAISLWNPLVLGLSLLANTRFALAIVDLFSSINLLLSALMFALLGMRLRALKSLPISDNQLIFLSLSYAFSSYAINIGACWLMFLANQAALPMIALGFFAPNRKNGVFWTALGVLYALLVGHLSPLLFTLLFFSVFALGLCWAERSFETLWRWALGLIAAVMAASPLLVPAALAFAGSARNESFSLKVFAESAVPFPALIAAYFGGYGGILLGDALGLFGRQLVLGLACCAANLQSFGTLRARLSRLDWVIGSLTLLVALFMARPHWLAVLVSHVPLYRSLRWPFRELYLFLFLTHLWLILRPVSVSKRAFGGLGIAGVAVFLVSLAIVPPWNFSAMETDRRLLISGQAQSYWARVKPLLAPGDKIVAVVSPAMLKNHEKEIPYSLIGACNYPALFDVPSISGYTAQGLAQSKLAGKVLVFGIQSSQTSAQLLASDAHIKALQLVSLHPLRIDLCSSRGCQSLPVPQSDSVP